VETRASASAGLSTRHTPLAGKGLPKVGGETMSKPRAANF